MKIFTAAGCVTLLFLFLFQGDAFAQNTVPNGDFELQAQGPWVLTGSNVGAGCTPYNTTGSGTSYCWKRKPGTNNGNGGIEQDVPLIGGLAYDVSIPICYIATC
jgi:hypothetical protein